MPRPRSNMHHERGSKKARLDIEEDVDDTDIEDVDMDAMTDSEEEYTERERKLLEKARKRRTSENYDSEDEVYPLRGDSADEEDEEEEEDNQQVLMGSDVEELQEDDLPDDRAWGKKARNFYSSDYKYTDYATATQRDMANAEMEEQEAKKLHTRSADENFDIIDDRFIQTVEDSKDDRQIVELCKLNEKQKQTVEQKELNAFVALVTDFKECMMEMNEILIPFLKLVENGTCPDCDAIAFIRTKYHVVLNYCTNISFYLMLKAKSIAVHSHPVIKRLEQYRQLLAQLQSSQRDLLDQAAEIVKAVKEGKPLYNIADGSQQLFQKLSKEKISRFASLSKKLTQRKEMAMHEREQLPDSTDITDMDEEGEFTDEENLDAKEERDSEDKEDEEDKVVTDAANDEQEKRPITYEMAKNRGLTPYRKKELRNPRVKHRIKYRKAKIRRRGAVREVRKELTRYAGEISGIKAGVVKSIKLK